MKRLLCPVRGMGLDHHSLVVRTDGSKAPQSGVFHEQRRTYFRYSS